MAVSTADTHAPRSALRERRKPVRIEDFEPLIGTEAVDRIMRKAAGFRDFHAVHVSSTYYGGGVAEILSSLTLLMNNAGIDTDWRIIQGANDFFGVTKKLHNALQGAEINLTELKEKIYEEVIFENSLRNHLDHHDMVIVHDPQPLGMIEHYRKNGPWIWRCHLDLTRPHPEAWAYIRPLVEKYDAVILSLPEYRQKMTPPQLFFMPAINPFLTKNRDFTEEEIDERLRHYKVPTDLPLVVQISRFDKWKDPEGVIRAYKKARKEVDCTLVLMGNLATDDPEGREVYDALLEQREERILILTCEDTAIVNALQRKAAVVLQKSLREGFGLTVTEAMWKGAAVVGGNAGGIRHQIEDGKNGFLVSTEDEAADRIVRLLKDETLRRRLGAAARETVRRKFLMSRLFEQYLDLFGSFETVFRMKARPGEDGAGRTRP
jgi:trehalose synthase